MVEFNFALIFCFIFYRTCSAGIPSNATTEAGHTLIGFTKGVYKGVIDLDECYEKCLTKVFVDGTHCKSGEFYGADHECLLNSETKETQPSSYKEEPVKGVTYFEVPEQIKTNR